MTAKDKPLFNSARKVSEIFLDYASPLLDFAGPDVTKTELENFLKLAFITWNSVILDEHNPKNHLIKEMKQLIRNAEPPIRDFLMMMVQRKKTDFAQEKFLIGTFKVYKEKGDFRVQVEARAKPEQKN